MDSLSLDAVRTTGVGASVLPTDRCHRQAAITHLGPRRERAEHPPWGPTNAIPWRRGSWGSYTGGDTEPGVSCPISLQQTRARLHAVHSVTRHVKWEVAVEREEAKEGEQGRSAAVPTENPTYLVFPTST